MLATENGLLVVASISLTTSKDRYSAPEEKNDRLLRDADNIKLA